ncbi:hypothetical protein ACHAWC_007593, partial [Mediolabrus comicus]
MFFRSYCTAAIAALAVTSSSSIYGVSAAGILRGSSSAATSAKNHDHHHRALQVDEEYTFLIADIQYDDAADMMESTGRNRKLQGNSNNSQGHGKGLNKPEHTVNVQDSYGFIYEIEAGSGDTSGITSGAKVTLPDVAFRNPHANGKINLAGGKIEKSKKPKNKRALLQEESTEEQKRNLAEVHRHLATSGPKKVIAVRVNTSNGSYVGTEAELSDSLFSYDNYSLKKGYEQCSHGQLTINPGTLASGVTSGTSITNGVMTIDVAIEQTGSNNGDITNAVTAKINELFGVSNPTAIGADYLMYCLPSGAMPGIAYAYINNWMSVYQDSWCRSPSAQMHEVGHNFGFGHSNEGATEYGDQSGMMGYSYGTTTGPVMCFNAAKSYQSGWFADETLTMNIGGKQSPTDNCIGHSEEFLLTGQAEYVPNAGQNILVKINAPTANDYFLMYNKQVGINSGTQEGGGQVLIVQAGAEGSGYAPSNLVSKLSSGGSYSIPDFLGDGTAVNINFIEVVNGKASIKIEYGSYCTATFAPTACPDISVLVTTDGYPEETGWTLTKDTTDPCPNQSDLSESVAAGTFAGSPNTAQAPYTIPCVDQGKYVFTITDSYGDGICCGYGSGSYSVIYGGVTVASGGAIGSGETTKFGTCASSGTPPPTPPPVNPPPTPNPTNPPTNFPTNPPPTSVPTNPPTPNPTNAPTNFPTPFPTNPPPTP